MAEDIELAPVGIDRPRCDVCNKPFERSGTPPEAYHLRMRSGPLTAQGRPGTHRMAYGFTMCHGCLLDLIFKAQDAIEPF